MTATATQELLPLGELAERLRLHPSTVRNLYRTGVIPGLRIGHRTLRFSFPEVLDALRAAGDPAGDQAER